MSGGINYGSGSPFVMTKDAFLAWLRELPIDPLTGKPYPQPWRPRVRVPVERQTPNEADL